MKNSSMNKTGKMWHTKYWGRAAACAFAVVFLLTACGSSPKSASGASEPPLNAESADYDAAATESSFAAEEYESGDYEEAYREEAMEPAAAEDTENPEQDEAGGVEDAGDLKDSGRKIIYTGDISLQTLEYENSSQSIHDKITKYGGFIEAENSSNDDPYWYYSERSGSSRRQARRNLNITARIPAEKFDAFMKDLENDGQVIRTSVNARNISVKYATHEASRKALEIEQKRLLEMMEKAETVEDMILVEQRLTEVERELNDEKTELSDMDRDVGFSTVNISLQEVYEYSEKVVETTFGEQLKKAFNRAIEGFAEFWKDVILFVAETFPFLIMIGIVIYIIVRHNRRARRRRAEELAKMQNAQGGPNTGMPVKRKRSFFRRRSSAGNVQPPAGAPGVQNPDRQPPEGAPGEQSPGQQDAGLSGEQGTGRQQAQPPAGNSNSQAENVNPAGNESDGSSPKEEAGELK